MQVGTLQHVNNLFRYVFLVVHTVFFIYIFFRVFVGEILSTGRSGKLD